MFKTSFQSKDYGEYLLANEELITKHTDYGYLNFTAEIYPDNDKMGGQKIINHPVHIYDTNLKQLSPSSFIPFCDFGGNKDGMGVKVDQFYSPVCSSFEARVLNDQLCYEVDPNQFTVARDSISDSNGLTLFIDTNHERQYPKNNMLKGTYHLRLPCIFNIVMILYAGQEFMIYLNTLGRLQIYEKTFLTTKGCVCGSQSFPLHYYILTNQWL